jgi:hypothetical protein
MRNDKATVSTKPVMIVPTMLSSGLLTYRVSLFVAREPRGADCTAPRGLAPACASSAQNAVKGLGQLAATAVQPSIDFLNSIAFESEIARGS